MAQSRNNEVISGAVRRWIQVNGDAVWGVPILVRHIDEAIQVCFLDCVLSNRQIVEKVVTIGICQS
jgi:hypothetical protein